MKGAFQRFDHDHYFEILPGGGTRMRDVFDYAAPLGLIGRLADVIFLKRYMRHLLVERNAAIKRSAEAG